MNDDKDFIYGKLGMRNSGCGMKCPSSSTPNSELRIPNSLRAKSIRVRSQDLLKEARRYLVGGVNSPVRAFRHVGSEPLILARANGAEVVSDGGERFIDFIMGWGALILGHNHPFVIRALKHALNQGELMGLTHPSEVELAKLITQAVPSVEQVRFTVSGTEACMIAVRLARAHTSRTKIVTFEGCYHGHSDSLMARSSAGIPGLLAQETLSVPYNDGAALEETLKRHGHKIACVIVEPVAANMGVVLPNKEFLQHVRELTSKYGIVLVFDEVVTGFRVSYGGAAGLFKIRADLTTFGKIIGGGLPIGALGGSRRLMRRLAPDGDVFHGGTFAGHPLSMAAGIATLRQLSSAPPYDKLERLSKRLADGLMCISDKTGVRVHVNRIGSMMTCFFSSAPVTNADGAKSSRKEIFSRWANTLRQRRVLVPPSPFEALFISSVHTEDQIEELLDGSRDAMR